MAFKIAEAFVNISAKMSPLKSGLARAKGAVDGFVSRAPALIAGFGAATAGAAVGLLKLASDAEETDSKFQAVFKDQTAAANEFVTSLASSVGRSENQLKGFVAGLGDTFNPLGFATEQSRELAGQVTKLGIDLASFNNLSDAEAIESLTSALIGNHESVRKFGVIITEATLDAELMKLGIQGGTKAASEQQKALARLNIIMSSTTDAQGDAERTSGSLANQTKALFGSLMDLGANLGALLIEPAKAIVGLFMEWVAQAKAVSETVQPMSGFGDIFSTIKEWVSAVVMAFLNWDLVTRRIGILMAEVFLNVQSVVSTFFENIGIGLDFLWRNWKGVFSTIVDFVLTVFINLGKNIREFFSRIWDYIKSGGQANLEFDFSGLTEGFRATVNSPEFKKALPISLKDQLDEVDAEWQVRLDKVAEKTKTVAKATGDEQKKAFDVAGEIKNFEKKDGDTKGKGGFKDIVSAWKDINEKLFAKKDTPAEQAVKTQKEQLAEQKKTNSLLAKQKGEAIPVAS